MILDIYEYLLATYGTAIGATTSKGFPTWARPELSLPLVALELTGLVPGIGRVGQQYTQTNVGYQGWLFARNEPELCAMLDALRLWHKNTGSAFEIAAQRVACSLQKAQRHEPLTDAIKEAHAVTFVVEVAFTG